MRVREERTMYIARLPVPLMAGLVLVSGLAQAADAVKGRQAFMKAGCYECHGTVGQGGITGPKLAPEPMALEALSAFLRNSSQAMPPYTEKVLSESDVADIHAYLASLPKAPDPKSIQLLNP
jgi:mono/diheme cytochrome c family protein